MAGRRIDRVNGARRRIALRVEGIVQGVGFRPYVHGLATSLGLAGIVLNDAQGVYAELEGDPAAVRRFLGDLEPKAPPLARIQRVGFEELAPTRARGFRILASPPGGERQVLISPDSATCADCLRELADPEDRRYRYPFINCTNCGPRFTIIRDVPYDRPNTTMAGFPMCPACEREYHDPSDRRFHAQPMCCPACGPALLLTDPTGTALAGEPVGRTAALLDGGAVVAIKGLGGYHLAVDAADETAVARLRGRKRRADKPFAVLVGDLAAAAALCEVSAEAAAVLQGPGRPIVLLPARPGTAVAPSVAPGNRYLGLLLPYAPVHHLLAGAFGRPFVCTSGNVSDEPIAYHDAEARERLEGIADAFLSNNRPIHMRTDDSVVRVTAGATRLVRRSRGYVPEPITLAEPLRRPVLACGAELKNAFALAKGRYVFVSHHIGDLENYETYRSFTAGIDHFRRLFDVQPAVVAHDLHPEYLSTKFALGLDGPDRIEVQHHHAHIASCLADNGEPGPVIGVAFDGLGMGTDGALWGGEFLVADLLGFERAAHLAPVPLPGGSAAIRQPWRMAAAYLDLAYDRRTPAELDLVIRHAGRWADVLELARSGVNSPPTTSAGRLFDAVAAILGVRDEINYEGQAAIELEQRAARVEPSAAGRSGVGPAYPIGIGPGDPAGGPLVLDGPRLVRDVTEDVLAGTDPDVVAARFHVALAAGVVETCQRLAGRTGIGTVALSGGVFQNVLLLEAVVAGLSAAGLGVLVHRQVPPNDGGISLGQVAVAGALDRG